MKVDMSAKAVTRRLRQTSELRRLCIALGYKRYIAFKKSRLSSNVVSNQK